MMATTSLISLLQIMNCFYDTNAVAAFDSHSSFSDSLLYYDFSRGYSQQVAGSPFTENTFSGTIIDNSYLDISDTASIIGSDATQSYSSYTVVFDVEFPEIIDTGVDSAYFWGADSDVEVNTGGWDGNQYHFKLNDGKLGIENWSFGPDSFPNSPIVNSNTRYLIAYAISPTSAEAYIDAVSAGTQTLDNEESGTYSNFYIKIGGDGHADRPEQPMKLYQYAFYDGILSQADIAELNGDLCAKTSCEFGAVCDATDGSCVVDCDAFQIDSYVMECSVEFANTQESINSNAENIEELQQTISGLLDRIDALERQSESDEPSGQFISEEILYSENDNDMNESIDIVLSDSTLMNIWLIIGFCIFGVCVCITVCVKKYMIKEQTETETCATNHV